LYRTSGRILDRIFGTVRPSCAHGHFPRLTLLWPRPRPDPGAPMPCSGRGMAPLPRCRLRALILAYVGARPRCYFPSLTLSALSSLPTTGTRARSPCPPEHATAITVLSFSTPAHHLLVLPVPLAPHGLRRPHTPLSGPRRAVPPITVGCRHRCCVLQWPGHHGPS
jgi:hypothetical protein